MAVHLSVLLVLTGLTGIHSITTVSEVSVKAGGSISIPCLYDAQYRNNVKYLCNGYHWSSCSDAVKTNQQNSGRFSISDDKSRRIFTVAINGLTDEDAHFWCAVDIKDRADVGQYFHLSVTRGTPSLSVDHQEVTGFKGNDLTINCKYSNPGEMKWCRLGSSCVTGSSGSIDGTAVTINASVPNVFTVTMRTESSGWYYCVKGDLQMPVHVTVTERPSRTDSITTVSEVSVKAGDSISIPCLYNNKYTNHVKYLCKGLFWSSCSYAVKTNQQNSGRFSISDDKSQRIFTVAINTQMDTDTDYWCAVEIDGDLDVGQRFHLSVTTGTPSLYVDHQEVTGFKGDDLTISCHFTNSGEMKWCRLGSSCVTGSSGSIDGTAVTINVSVPNVFTVTMSGLRTESSGWYYCVNGDLQMPVNVTVTERPTTSKHATTHFLTPMSSTAEGGNQSLSDHLMIFGIRLSVLTFVVMVSLFIWFMYKRHKQEKVQSFDATMTEGEVRCMRKTSGEAVEEVVYMNAECVRKTSGERSHAEGDVEEK